MAPSLSNLEYVLIIWVISFILVEVRQFFRNESETSSKFEGLKNYFRDGWNYFDIFGSALFLMGMFFRFLSVHLHAGYLVPAR
jgi:hypothetical protein